MSSEGTSRARKHEFEEPGKKSKKGRKRKVWLAAENENAEDVNGVHNFDEAGLNERGSNEALSLPRLKKHKKKKKMLEGVNKQVQGSREKDNKQQVSSKPRKHVKFNLESSSMSPDQGKEEPVEECIHKDVMKEDKELKKPSDTTWVQKSSWKSLVGETGRVNFRLGSVVGHNSSMLPSKELTSTGSVQPSMNVQSSDTVSAWIEGSSSTPLMKRSSQSNGHLGFSYVKNTSKLVKKSETQSDLETCYHQSGRTPEVQDGLKRNPQKFSGKNDESQDLKQADHQDGVEKVCRFMRSDNYEQEWLEAKRAVKDIFKRSRKDALKSIKMFHKKHNP